jgi:hypothetical protein
MVITNRIAAALVFLVVICSNNEAFIPKMRVLPLKEQEEPYKCKAGLTTFFPFRYPTRFGQERLPTAIPRAVSSDVLSL